MTGRFNSYTQPVRWPVVLLLWIFRRRLGRGPLVAVLFFIGTLTPALGFVNVYPMALLIRGRSFPIPGVDWINHVVHRNLEQDEFQAGWNVCNFAMGARSVDCPDLAPAALLQRRTHAVAAHNRPERDLLDGPYQPGGRFAARAQDRRGDRSK